MLGQKLDHLKDCSIGFGSCVQASAAATNTEAPRARDAIFLRHLHTTGGHQLLDLVTGASISRHHVKVVPMPTAVITRVEEMAEAQQIKSLTVTTKKGKLLHDSSLLAGVDPSNNQDQDNDEDEDDSDYEPDTEEAEDDDEEEYDRLEEPDFENTQDPGEPTEQQDFNQAGDQLETIQEGEATQEQADEQPNPAARRSTRTTKRPVKHSQLMAQSGKPATCNETTVRSHAGSWI